MLKDAENLDRYNNISNDFNGRGLAISPSL